MGEDAGRAKEKKKCTRIYIYLYENGGIEMSPGNPLGKDLCVRIYKDEGGGRLEEWKATAGRIYTCTYTSPEARNRN